MKCLLGISNFFEEISSLFHSIFFLYFFASMGVAQFKYFSSHSGQSEPIFCTNQCPVLWHMTDFNSSMKWVKKKKTTKKKQHKNIQDFINTQCFMAATGFKYFFTHCTLTESFITIHCFSTLTCFKCFYINPGAKFLVDINSQHFSFGAWPNGLFILAHKPNSVVCHHPVFTYCDILKELHYQP